MSSPSLESVTTIGADGSRQFLHPTSATGRYSKWRKFVFGLLILCYIIPPWIPINGSPAIFLNVAERKFHLFGATLVSEDLWLVFFLITGLAFSLFYLTALFGRVWCGWACPQTVWLEGVYRRIEVWIEGNPNRRRKLDAAPWNADKTIRRLAKHGLFITVSLMISHVFMSYFVSIPGLYAMTRVAPLENWTVFLWVFVMGGILYFNFAWFREQLCIVVCPYGRLQSALIDDDSIVIGYDANRGEPRGKVNTAGAGDCIDCHRCVTVCPTGIDIRQGLQMECIGCTACIDECDDVMTRLKRPTGLIRHDSMNGLAGRQRRIVRPRTLLYSVLLLIGASALFTSLSRLEPFTASVTRFAGPPYYQEGETLRNHFQVRISNKSSDPASFKITVESEAVGMSWSPDNDLILLEPLGERMVPLFITLPREVFLEGAKDLTVVVSKIDGPRQIERPISFLGPNM